MAGDGKGPHSDYTFQSYGFVLIIWNVETFRFIPQMIPSRYLHLGQFGPISTSPCVGQQHVSNYVGEMHQWNRLIRESFGL